MLLLFNTLYLTFVSRWHGGGFFYAPRILKNIAWSIPFAYAGFLALGWIGAILAFTGAFLKTTGGGNGIDYGTMPDGDPEFFEFLILWLKPYLSKRMYDILLDAVVGFVPFAVLVGVLLYVQHPLLALAGAVGGLARGLGYYVGWTILPAANPNLPKDFREPTQIAEALAGTFAGIALGIIISYLHGMTP